MASEPSCAVTTEYPSYRSFVEIAFRITGSSSTIRIFFAPERTVMLSEREEKNGATSRDSTSPNGPNLLVCAAESFICQLHLKYNGCELLAIGVGPETAPARHWN